MCFNLSSTSFSYITNSGHLFFSSTKQAFLLPSFGKNHLSLPLPVVYDKSLHFSTGHMLGRWLKLSQFDHLFNLKETQQEKMVWSYWFWLWHPLDCSVVSAAQIPRAVSQEPSKTFFTYRLPFIERFNLNAWNMFLMIPTDEKNQMPENRCIFSAFYFYCLIF